MMAVQAYWIAVHFAGKKTMKPAKMLGERDTSGFESRDELRQKMQEIEEDKGFGEVIKLGTGDEEVVIELESELDLDGWLLFDDDVEEPEAV